MRTYIRNTLLAALLAAAIPAQAAIQTWNFSGTVDSGSLLGQNYVGQFSFDDLGLTGSGDEYLAVSSLGMQFNGTAFTLADELATTEAAFADGSFLGMNFSAANFTFITGSVDTSDAFLALDDGAANVIYAPVPEPETYALMLAGLGLVGMKLRARNKRITLSNSGV